MECGPDFSIAFLSLGMKCRTSNINFLKVWENFPTTTGGSLAGLNLCSE